MVAEPDITLTELRERLADMGVNISRQAINTALHALGYRYKKKRRTQRSKSAPMSRASAVIGATGRLG